MNEDVELRIGGKPRRFENVEHEYCEACGERIFGLKASRRFDAALPRRRGPRAA